MNTQLTIAICTFNRAFFLKKCISSLLSQNEISLVNLIIIDNNSSDDTKEIVIECIKQNPDLSVKYEFEKKQGLSVARNKAIEKCDTDYIGFIDDDAAADEKWIFNALEIINNLKPDAFGGPIHPYYITTKPQWFKDVYGTYSDYNYTGWIDDNYKISGGNMFFLKNKLIEIGKFDESLGMKGNFLGYSEESKAFTLLHKANNRIYYSKNLIVNHHVPDIKFHLLHSFYSNINSAINRAKFSFENKNSISDINLINNLIDITNTQNNLKLEINNCFETIKDKNNSEIKDEQLIIEKIIPSLYNMFIEIEKTRILLNKKKSITEKIKDLSINKIINYFKKN